MKKIALLGREDREVLFSRTAIHGDNFFCDKQMMEGKIE